MIWKLNKKELTDPKNELIRIENELNFTKEKMNYVTKLNKLSKKYSDLQMTANKEIFNLKNHKFK